jgi:hypothetical protein
LAGVVDWGLNWTSIGLFLTYAGGAGCLCGTLAYVSRIFKLIFGILILLSPDTECKQYCLALQGAKFFVSGYFLNQTPASVESSFDGHNRLIWSYRRDIRNYCVSIPTALSKLLVSNFISASASKTFQSELLIAGTSHPDAKCRSRYLNGMWATIGQQLLMLTCVGALTITYARRNQLRRQGKLTELEGNPDFYYTLWCYCDSCVNCDVLETAILRKHDSSTASWNEWKQTQAVVTVRDEEKYD